MRKVTLAKRAFQRWLKAKDPAEPVGNTRSRNSCPLATFIYAQGAVYVAVAGSIEWSERDQYNTNQYGYSVRARDWQNRFIKIVDRMAAMSVTAGQALAALDMVDNPPTDRLPPSPTIEGEFTK